VIKDLAKAEFMMALAMALAAMKSVKRRARSVDPGRQKWNTASAPPAAATKATSVCISLIDRPSILPSGRHIFSPIFVNRR
jgi:hypothetical protein